jgi:hypothetical protein
MNHKAWPHIGSAILSQSKVLMETALLGDSADVLVNKVSITGLHDEVYIRLIRKKALLAYLYGKATEEINQYMEDKWKDVPSVRIESQVYSIDVELKNGENKTYS